MKGGISPIGKNIDSSDAFTRNKTNQLSRWMLLIGVQMYFLGWNSLFPIILQIGWMRNNREYHPEG